MLSKGLSLCSAARQRWRAGLIFAEDGKSGTREAAPSSGPCWMPKPPASPTAGAGPCTRPFSRAPGRSSGFKRARLQAKTLVKSSFASRARALASDSALIRCRFDKNRFDMPIAEAPTDTHPVFSPSDSRKTKTSSRQSSSKRFFKLRASTSYD